MCLHLKSWYYKIVNVNQAKLVIISFISITIIYDRELIEIKISNWKSIYRKINQKLSSSNFGYFFFFYYFFLFLYSSFFFSNILYFSYIFLYIYSTSYNLVFWCFIGDFYRTGASFLAFSKSNMLIYGC